MSLKEIAIIILPVSGTLLGLLYAAFIYWLQGGFSRFSYSNEMFEDVLVGDVRILLDVLAASGIICLFLIFDYKKIASYSLYFFTFIYLKDILLSASYYGYLNSVFSTKFIPENMEIYVSFFER